MGIIVAVASNKGGAGKTTLCQVVAGYLAGQCRVAVIDADPEQSLSRWVKQTYEGPPIDVHAEGDETGLASLIGTVADSCDLLIIDTAGFANRAALVAMTACDLVLVPCLSAEADLAGTEKTVRMVAGLAKAARRQIDVRVLLNRTKARTELWRHAVAELERSGMPMLTTKLSDLVGYGELTYSGRLPAKASPARAEIVALVDELRASGWLPPRTIGELDV
ncbi:AAA family ATPase [Paeniroseomonas aquatica]|uniref:ParA family protein n=1 Tax=Paeniroseomonas aquatica TaxID=373043 RepID=A0ABT8A0Y3_9PROT|nr:ParA family protein [Paeniroseomonas aquatica]MDN3563143.1 ParA family protein [Paeniroseomonas aquatica]